MKKLFLFLLAVTLLIACPVEIQNSAAAQTSSDPMFFFRTDDILGRWTEADGFQEVGPLPDSQLRRFSPTSEYLVYAVLTESAAEAAAGGFGGGTLPTNLWLMDTATGETTLIAGQSGETDRPEIARGDMEWSPDGTMIAWTEGTDSSSLVVYEVAAGISATVAEGIPSQTMVGTPAEIRDWTETGILFERIEFDDRFQPYHAGFTLYGPDGTLISELPPLPTTQEEYRILERRDGTTGILFMIDDGNWQIMDVLTGEFESVTGGVLARHTIGMAETSLRIDPPILAEETGEASWDVYSPDGDLLTTLSGDYPILSPSGRQILYDREGTTLSIWRSEAEGGPYTLEVPWASVGVVLWGITTYDLERDSAQVINGTRCEGSELSFRLMGGITSTVLGNSPNNLRSLPGLDAEIIGQIPGGASIDVISGPQCMDGIAWWVVDYLDLTGWTAEGADGEYWLAPGPGGGVG